MKIVISGGWGYGNLGDDAILDSTIRQLQVQFPGCECVVLTYNLQDSAIHAAQRVKLRLGIHALTDGGGCEIFRPVMTEDYGLRKKALVKAKYAVTETEAWFKHASKPSLLRELEVELASADLFVMSGGGYFNEKWMNKTRAQVLELQLAAKAGVPAIVLGPTIGRFTGAIRAEIEASFRKAQLITVRDEFSFAEAEQWSDRVSVVPDIALGNWLPPVAQPQGLGIVFTSQDSGFRQRTALAIKRFQGLHREAWPVRLFLTRRWKYDLRAAIAFQEDLQAQGVTSELVMPSNFQRLEQGLADCRLVISENLHGLILAARNLVPVVAINDYPPGSPNFKKFIAFLAQSNSQELYFNSLSSPETIAAQLIELANTSEAKRNDLHLLRELVVRQYGNALAMLAKRIGQSK